MADFPTVALLVGFIVLVILYFALRLAKETVFVVLSFIMIILSVVGYSLTEGTSSRGIFEMFLILSLISIPITILQYVLNNARDWILTIGKSRM